MTRINLLPVRYSQFRAFARQILWGLVGLTVLLVILGTVRVGLQARTDSYTRMSAILMPGARQYRTINARFDQLQRAEKTLLARREKSLPLLDRSRSILPGVEDFVDGLPSGTSLTDFAVTLDGQITLSGQAKTYNDVSRFVKWVGETLGYQEVVLTSLRRGQGQYVEFGLTAVRPQGGGAL